MAVWGVAIGGCGDGDTNLHEVSPTVDSPVAVGVTGAVVPTVQHTAQALVDESPPTPTPVATVAEGDTAPAKTGEPGSVVGSPVAPVAVQGPAMGAELPVQDERVALANLVHATFPDNPRMSNHVVWAETLNLNNWWEYVYGGRMSATNDCGLMQINWPSHAGKFAAHGWTLDDCFVPERNLIIAREVYDNAGGGWPWTTY